MADPQKSKSRRSCLMFIVIAVILLLGLGVLWWWITRPIQPVELTPQEREVVAQKVEAVQKPEYQPGKKEIVFTERELNGLLNDKTEYGEQIKFELVQDAILARVETDLDEGIPVVGGKRLKAKAKFTVKQAEGQVPELVVEDVTVWSVSLPNDWLGGVKGHNLLAQLLGEGSLPGIKSISVQPEQLIIRLKD